MAKLKFLFKDEEEEKEKFGISQRVRGIGELPKYEFGKVGLEKAKEIEIPESTKLKFTSDIGVGVKEPETSPIDEEADFSTPLGKIQYYKSKIDWLEGIAKQKGGFDWEGSYDAYRYAIEQHNKAVKEYNINIPLIKGLPKSLPSDKPKPEVPSGMGIHALNKPEQMGKIQKGVIGAFGTWEAKKKANPELQKMEDFANLIISEAVPLAKLRYGEDYSKKGTSIEEVAIIYERLTDTPREETLKDIEGIKNRNIFFTAPPEKYKEAVKLYQQLGDIRRRVAEPGADIIGQLGWAGMVVILGVEAVAGIMSVSPIIKEKILNKEIKTNVSTEKSFKALQDISGRGGTTEQRKIFDTIIAQAKAKGVSVSDVIRKGVTVTETVPRFAFAGKLYAGLPADEIAKSIVEVGKVTAEAVKGLDPVKVSQVTQQLLATSPALASEFLKAVEKPEEILKIKPEVPIKPPIKPVEEKIEEKGRIIPEILKTRIKAPIVPEIAEKEIIPTTTEEAKEILKIDPKKPSVAKDMLAKHMVEKKVSLTDIEAVKGEKIDVTKPKDIIIALRDIKAVKKEEVVEPTPKIIPKEIEPTTEKPAAVEAPVAEKVITAPAKVEVKVEPGIELASPTQINKAYSIAKSKAMISEEGKLKPQFRKIAEIFTGAKYIEKMTPEEAEMFIDQLDRLPEPKYRNGKLVPPSIPRTMKLTTEGFFQKKYGEPTPIWLLTDQTYYATKLGIKPLIEPFEKGKQEFDLEFRKSSNLVDRMVNKLNQVAKTSMGDRIKSKVKNVPTKAESKMAGLVNEYETTPPGLSPKEEDIFKYFRNLSKDIWRRENEVREKVDLPPIKYKTAYFRHTADAMAKEMIEGKYPFPQGIKYWSEKMVGKKIFNPMEFHRRLSDDLIDLWSKDIRAVTKAMLWNGLKEIHLAEPSKFLSEQLNAISKDLPEYKNLTPRERAAYDQTRVMPASTKKWLINYVNQVIKGQETELDASLNRIVTKSGLKGIFDKVLSPFGRSVGRKPITNIASLSGRMVISGVMGWVPRQIIRNAWQQVQNLALYGVNSTIKAFLPASIDKNLKGLLSESLFLKSYTGYEELPTNLMAKLEKVWLGPYGIVAVNNAKQGMKAAYWNILELIKNPKFKKYGWADPQRTKETPKGFLYPSEKEKLLKEMEFGSSCTQYQYIPMGMPGVFRYKALVPVTRLQSWWMNYITKFNAEAFYRLRKGETSYGAKLPWSRRINWAKYLILGGAILIYLGYRRSFMLGVLPRYLSPAVQVALGLYNYATATEDWQKKRALNQIYYSWKAFIPGSLAWRDFIAVWNGEKDLNEILFYGKKEEKAKKKIIPSIEIEGANNLDRFFGEKELIKGGNLDRFF